MNNPPPPTTPPPPSHDIATAAIKPGHAERLEQLPPEIGLLIVGVGLVGLVFPGPFGTPLMIAGGLSLWPRAFRPADRWMARKFPKAHTSGAYWLERFMDDLDHRYPPNSQNPTQADHAQP